MLERIEAKAERHAGAVLGLLPGLFFVALVLIGAAGVRHLSGYSRTHQEPRVHVAASECDPA